MAKNNVSFQEAWELRRFLQNLQKRRITTPDFKSALMIVREHCASNSALREWTDSIAHKKRNRGITFEAGVGLWIEKFQVDAYFSSDFPAIKRIPIPIFERLLSYFQDPNFNFGGMDTKSLFPGGHSIDEIVASIRFMYRKSQKEGVYKLISVPDENVVDLEMLRHFISELKHVDWGEPPFHFNKIQDDMADTFKRLIGAGKRQIDRNADLLAVHFLSAFHLTEVDLTLRSGSSKTRCFLSVDSTSSGHLSLSLGLYRRKSGEWDAFELAQPNRHSRVAGSHCYTRPFLLTDLTEAEYFLNGNGSECSYSCAVEVKTGKSKKCILHPVPNN